MGSILNIATEALDEAIEPTIIDTTEEIKIRVNDVRTDNNKNDEPYMLVTFEAPEIPGSKTFTKYFALPFDGMDPKKKNSSALQLRRFFTAFDIDYSAGELELEEILGREAWAIVGVDVNEGSEYGPQNYIKKFM